MEKLKYVKLEVVQPKIKNKPSISAREWIIPYLSSHEVLQSWLSNTVYHLLILLWIMISGGRGGGGLKEKGGHNSATTTTGAT